MKLYYSNTSPYARKTRIVVIEKDLTDQVEEEIMLPLQNPEILHAANPLGKIPSLVLNSGESLFDSPVISRYLDSLSENNRLIHPGNKQWGVLRGEALADGMIDAAFSLVMERLRPEEEQSTLWKVRWESAIHRSLAEIENTIDELKVDFNLAQIATAVAISYLKFRLPDLLNESLCPKTQLWLAEFKQRNSMQATEFQG